ncbi:MAG: glycosyltransferase [Acidimicrobiales bacterium]|nr:glycosyltransferase [Acidimicrobiales bacterium]
MHPWTDHPQSAETDSTPSTPRRRFAPKQGSGPLALVVGLVAVAGGNVVFHLLAGRLLGSDEYGSLSALMTILLALAVPAGAIQVALTAEVARIDREGRRVRYGPALLQFVAAGLVVASAIVFSGPVMGSYLKLDGIAAPLLVGLFFVPALGSLVPRAVLLGREQYGPLAAVLVAGVLLRIIGGTLVLAVRPSAATALAVILVSETVTTIWLWMACRRAPQPDSVAWDLRIRFGELVGGAAAFAGFWLVVGVDTLLARHQFVAAEAGAYAAAALAARTVLYVPQSIVTAALPKYALPGRAAREALFDSMLSSLVVGLASVSAVLLVGQTLLERVLGQSYALSSATLASLSVAALWAALLNAVLNFHLAQGSILRANASWIGVGVVLVGGHFVTGSAALSLVVLAAILVAGLLTASPLIRFTNPPVSSGPFGPATLDLSIVVPAFNEEANVATTLRQIATSLDELLVTSEIIVVDDGSRDATAELAEAVGLANVRVIRQTPNAGKGAALRTGMQVAQGEVIGFIDGDGDLDPRHLQSLYRELEQFQANAVVGSKRHRRSVVTTSRARRVVSAAGQFFIRWMFNISVSDTQVGVKLFRRPMVAEVLPRTRETGYLFDLEFLAIGAAHGWRHVVESPIVLLENRNSTIGFRAVLGTFVELVRFSFRLRGAGQAPSAVVAGAASPSAPSIGVSA